MQIFSIIASLFNIFSGATYFKQVLKNESTPNPATWLIWFVATILNTATYFIIVNGSIWVSLSSIVLAIEIFAIFVLTLFKGKFTRLGKIEIASLLIAFAVGIFWKLTGDAIISNILLQVIFIISFYPTIHGLMFNNAFEKSTPWFLAVVAYGLQIAVVLLNPLSLVALTFPIVNLVGNGSIGLLAIYKRRQK